MLHVPNSSFHTLPKLHFTSYLQSLVMVQNTLICCGYTPVTFIYPCCGSPFVRSDSLSHLPNSGLLSSFSFFSVVLKAYNDFFLEHSLGTFAASFSSSSPSLLPQLSRVVWLCPNNSLFDFLSIFGFLQFQCTLCCCQEKQTCFLACFLFFQVHDASSSTLASLSFEMCLLCALMSAPFPCHSSAYTILNCSLGATTP